MTKSTYTQQLKQSPPIPAVSVISGVRTAVIVFFFAFVALGSSPAFGYTIKGSAPSLREHGVRHLPPNHEKSVEDACDKTTKAADKKKFQCAEDDLVKGVKEPDQGKNFADQPFEMIRQRARFAKHGAKRNMQHKRMATQHIHGNPLPLVKFSWGSKAMKKGYKKYTWAGPIWGEVPDDAIRPIKKRENLWSTVTMGQLRNKMLSQSASWLCVGLSHPDAAQKWRKFGNFAHMVGDTYSASHTLRSETPGKELLMSFSMDTVLWKNHVLGDSVNDDPLFKALVKDLTELMKLYSKAQENLDPINENKEEFLPELNKQIDPIFKYLCEKTWKMSSVTLIRPAGGSTKKYSTAPASTIHYQQSVLPMGLASDSEFKAAVEGTNVAGKKIRSKTARAARIDFFYPELNAGDYCEESRRKLVLQCDWELEVKPAINKENSVDTMFVPQVDRSRPPAAQDDAEEESEQAHYKYVDK